jgi:hypothetical protein
MRAMSALRSFDLLSTLLDVFSLHHAPSDENDAKKWGKKLTMYHDRHHENKYHIPTIRNFLFSLGTTPCLRAVANVPLEENLCEELETETSKNKKTQKKKTKK